MERLDAELQVDLAAFPHLRSKSQTAIPSDLTLLSGAMSKVASLEKQLTHANRRSQKAELQLQFINRSAHATAHEPFYLEENKRLKSQLAEMEQFLADYGLIWVGANSEESEDEEEEIEDDDQPNWEVIKHNVSELNLIGGEGRSVVSSKNGAKQLVEKAQNMRLTLFSNGIMLGDGPFRTFAQSKHFLDDIRDGYFPRYSVGNSD